MEVNWDAIGATAELVGATAVIATLLYLAVQIKQNTMASRANALQSLTDISATITGIVFSNAETTKIWNLGLRGELDDETDLTRFTLLLTQWFVSYESVFLQHQLGAVSDEFFESRMAAVLYLMSVPGVVVVWNLVKFSLTRSFVKYVESNQTEGVT